MPTPSPPGASTPSMDACSTSCSARPTTSAGCRPARSRARRSPRTSSSTTSEAVRQHAEMVSVYEQAGVQRPLPRARPALPYQVFARDSSINVPDGPIVTQCAQWWRRGEYAPVIRFYQAAGHPDPRDGHRRLARGRRLHDRRARRRRDRHRRGAHPGAGRAPGRRLARGGRLGGARRAHPAPLPPHRRARLHARREARGRVRRAGLERLRRAGSREGRRDRARSRSRPRSSSA